MPDFHQQLNVIARVRETCRQHEENLYGALITLERTRQRLRRAEQEQTVALADRDSESAALRAQIAELQTRLGTLREEVRR
jgi:septal ring factor EnvC (AmiA/AmiB activator)